MALTEHQNDLRSDAALRTAVILSLFTDARVDGERGWWGDEFLETPGDRIGSRLWLFERAKAMPDNAPKARQWALEALAWMTDDSVIGSIEAEAEATAERLALSVTISRPGANDVSFKFQHVWADAAWQEILSDGV